MIRSESEQETVFADLKKGEEFQIVPSGATFRKSNSRSAKLSKGKDATETKWVGASFFFGEQIPVLRVV